MEQVVITLQYKQDYAQQRIDLELPTNIPLSALLPVLIDKLGWHPTHSSTESDLTAVVRLVASRLNLQLEETMESAGILNGDILELSWSNNSAIPVQTGTCLQSVTTGELFLLRGKSFVAGRTDGLSAPPDIDLTTIDNAEHFITSRRHAHIWLREEDSQYWLKDLGSANGTFVNGRLLVGDERVCLQDGDEIQFGHRGPVVLFYLGKKQTEHAAT